MPTLLIIDMQKDSFTPLTSKYDALGVIERINHLSEKFREKGWPVVHIQHDGSAEGDYLPGTSGFEVIDEITVKTTDKIVVKTINDAFYKSELEAVLKNLDAEELIITGAATDFCVDATLKGAVVKDYKIKVISDAHTTSDKPWATAEMLITHYNNIWNWLSPTKYKVEVLSLNEFLSNI